MTFSGQPNGSDGRPATVFVSYASVDRAQVRTIVGALETAGYSVWWDGLLAGGDRFSSSIEQALETADAVVVLWSRAAIDSHWVRDEASRGRDRRCLVPVAIDGVEPPLGFRQLQTLSSPRGVIDASVIDPLLRAVAALHDGGRPAPTTKPASRSTLPNRRTVIGGAAALAGIGAVGAWSLGIFAPPAAGANSVAVLPFDDLGGDPSRQYFSDGLAAELRTELSRNPLLQVAAQTSSNVFRDSRDDARAICRALGVGFLLDGNVRRAGDMLRISAELIDGGTGFSRWTQTFDRPTTNIYAVQRQIAGAVTSALTREMVERRTAIPPGGTADLAAYDAYLRGKDQFDRAGEASEDRAALASFDAAIAADPAFALAHAARARVLTVIGNQYDQGNVRRARYDAAIKSARRAVAIAPDVAEAQSALGFALFNGRIDSRGARGPYERSLELGGGDADILSRYALFAARCGRIAPARRAIARAAELDPLNARTFRLIGEVEYSARAYAASIPPIERALGLDPNLSVARSAIGASRLMLGDIAAARTAYESEPSSLFRLTGLAIIAQRERREDDAAAKLAQLIAENGDNSLYQQAQMLAQWGREQDAVKMLLRARSQGDAGLVYIRNDPFLDPARRDPAFIRLLGDLGFE